MSWRSTAHHNTAQQDTRYANQHATNFTRHPQSTSHTHAPNTQHATCTLSHSHTVAHRSSSMHAAPQKSTTPFTTFLLGHLLQSERRRSCARCLGSAKGAGPSKFSNGAVASRHDPLRSHGNPAANVPKLRFPNRRRLPKYRTAISPAYVALTACTIEAAYVKKPLYNKAR